MEFLISQKNTNTSASQQIPEITVYTAYTLYIYISLSLSLIGLDVLTSQAEKTLWRVSTRFSQLWTKAIRFSSRFPRGHVVPLLAQLWQHRSPSCAPAVRGIQSLIWPFGKGSEPLSVYIILYIYIYTVCVCVCTKSMFYSVLWYVGLPHVIFEQCSKNTISSLFMSWLIEVPIGDRTVK